MRKLYTAGGIVCLLLSALFLFLSLPKRAPEKPEVVKEASAAVAERGTSGLEQGSDGYESPIDFTALKQMNEDIYAWLYVPGTNINHPVLQSQRGDNDYYLNHTVDRLEDENGCLFTEYLYSDKEFKIPVTVIYGHRRRSGDMFGQLQQLYSVTGSLEQYPDIYIYTPDKELHYQVFGESEFSNMHIPNHYRRFHDRSLLPVFVDELMSYHTMTKQFDPSVTITEEDRLLILSTCLQQNENQRFLVLAKLVEETN